MRDRTMTTTNRILSVALGLALSLTVMSCARDIDEGQDLESSESSTTTTTSTDRSITQNQPQQAITLPLLDAFFADSSFKDDLKREVGLSDSEVYKLQRVSREETSKLQDINGDDYTRTTSAATTLAEQRITDAIGKEKGAKLAQYLNRRWSGTATEGAIARTDSNNPGGQMNAVPTDTRIVVNAPAHRMDIFDSGKLVRSYTIAIGVPEFPLPVGMRNANEIIFNPTWTPPDESWIDSSTKYTAGKKIEAGSKLNPLGMAKIPIGLPSLIHGGKTDAQLGTFGSHGCVGLTDKQMRLFSQQLAAIAGDSIDTKELTALTKNKKETKSVKLPKSIPIELRYETIVAEDGQLYVYRDVYGRGTNRESIAVEVLKRHGVQPSQLSDTERTMIREALVAMSGDTSAAQATGSLANSGAAPDTSKKSSTSTKTGKPTASKTSAQKASSKKMRVIPIAALAGKGYPAAVLEDRKTATASAPKGK